MTAEGGSRNRDVSALLAHDGFVRAMAHGLVADAHAAEDVAQETWLASLRHPPAAECAARSWLGAVTRNGAYQFVRARTRRLEREQAAARDEVQPPASDPLIAAADRERVVDAVLALDEPYRQIVLLRFYEGLPPTLIAARLAVPIDTVKTRLKRALARLRKALGGSGRD